METEVDYKIEKQTIDKKQKQLQKKKPQQPKKKEDKDFFEAAFDKKVTKPSLKKNKCFWIGYLAGKQELKHGRSIKITTTEPFYFKGTTIPQGASLYGKVLFSKERILAKLETAVFHNNTIPTEIALYDIDYALGILVENLSPFIENAQNTLLQRMVSSTNYSIINDLGNSALHAISTIKNDKKITLENKKKVLLKPIEQNTR